MIYWFFLFIIFIMNFVKDKNHAFFSLFMLLMVFFIGWRYEVGGDWFSYVGLYEEIRYLTYSEALFVSDIGYSLLNKWSAELDGGVIFVNFICSLLFILGSYKLAIKLKYTWLVLFILFSYTLIAVAMGYTRQSVALGFIFLAFSSLLSKKPNKSIFAFWVLLGSLFHFSASIIFAFLPLINSKFIKGKFFLIYVFVLLILLPVLAMELFPESAYFVSDSETGDVSSRGALFRMIIHLLPLSLYCFYRKKIHEVISFGALIDALSLFVLSWIFLAFSYSTLADRFNVYFITFDLISICLTLTIIKNKYKSPLLITVLLYYGFFFTIWYFYSPFVECCYQYKNVIFSLWS